MLSIIVPVYNCGEYLNKCIESVLAQTMPDFELILVDDGSFDGSGEICDLWAQSDSRIRVIHQKNAGVSAARNAGLDAAEGEYIGFVDADDYIAPACFETALSSIGDCDMVMFDAVTVYDAGSAKDTISALEEGCVLEKKDWTPELLREMAGAVWRCVYRRELVRDIRFPVGIKFSEDRIFNLYAMGRAEKLAYLKRGLYFRLMQPDSAVHRFHEDYFDACLHAHAATMEALGQHWQSEGYQRAYNSHLVSGALGAIYNYFYKTSPLTFGKRLEMTRAVCENETLQRALADCDMGGLRATLLRRKWALALCAVAAAWNRKNGR